MTTTPDPSEQWKLGNEFAPFHPDASHVSPDYRDGWNACYRAAAKFIAARRTSPPAEGMPDHAERRQTLINALVASKSWMRGYASAFVDDMLHVPGVAPAGPGCRACGTEPVPVSSADAASIPNAELQPAVPERHTIQDLLRLFDECNGDWCAIARRVEDRFAAAPPSVRWHSVAQHDWGTETVFMNPPYSECEDWMRKAYGAAQEGATVVCLVPARTDTEWWHRYAMKGEVRLLKGRLKFGDAVNSAPFPSAVIVFRPREFKLIAWEYAA
jgi:hypothetical protein